ncbi:MAG: hypothetical protein JNM07_12130 [Phycisphaerae bacterium]|nr:hypothetical protein [Phycisphaerae bacterium]
MISPSPTTPISAHLARGVLERSVEATATRPGYIVMSVPNTSYALHLSPAAPVRAAPGKRLIGTIHAQARRIDRVGAGGRYIEPVAGRPRRVQGTVIARDSGAGTITLNCGVPVCVRTDGRQKAEEFGIGELVACDFVEMAEFREE